MSNCHALIEYVKRVIADGARTVEIPAVLLHDASEETISEVKGYCKLCGVKIVIKGN